MGDPYALSNDTAACWKSVGRRYRRKLTASEVGLYRAAAGAIIAELLGDDRSKTQAVGEIGRAVGIHVASVAGAMPSTPYDALPDYITSAMSGVRRRHDSDSMRRCRRAKRRKT
jgi:hypothetical protein